MSRITLSLLFSLLVSGICMITIISLGLPYWFILDGYKPLKNQKFYDWFTLTDLITWDQSMKDDAVEQGFTPYVNLAKDDIYYVDFFEIFNEFCECGSDCTRVKHLDSNFEDWCDGMKNMVALGIVVASLMVFSVFFGIMSILTTLCDYKYKSSQSNCKPSCKNGVFQVFQFISLIFAVGAFLGLLYSLDEIIEVDSIHTRASAYLLYIAAFLEFFVMLFYFVIFRRYYIKFNPREDTIITPQNIQSVEPAVEELKTKSHRNETQHNAQAKNQSNQQNFGNDSNNGDN